MIAISSGAKAKDAAAKLRAGFNKMKESGDELAKLAAFLIDALDDAAEACNQFTDEWAKARVTSTTLQTPLRRGFFSP
jgi:hypothetical protein